MSTRAQTPEKTVEVLIHLRDATDPQLAGRKAANLARMLNAGMPVPPGWVVPVDLAERVAGGEIDVLTPEVLNELPDVPLAVRSSGVTEDGDDESLAGQYESLLNVQGREALVEAIRNVWLSGQRLRRATAIEDTDSTQTAILIQPMLHPASAGVAFSANPLNGNRDEVIINAVSGLGDRLMAGEVDPETWTCLGTRCTVDPETSKILSAQQAASVADLARQVEQAFGTPQDIEWAIDGGVLYLLQARPVTALPVDPRLDPPPPGPWVKESEHFTGIVSVAQFSLHAPTMEEATRQLSKELGILADYDRHIDRAGEMYTQEVPLDGKHGTPPPGWLIGLLVRVIPSLRARVRQTKVAMEQDIFGQWADAWKSRWKDELRDRARELNSRSLPDMDDRTLAKHLNDIRDLLMRGRLIHMRLAVPAVYAPFELFEFCRDSFGWNETEAMTLVGATAYASSAPSKAIAKLASEARKRPELVQLLNDSQASLADIARMAPDFAEQIANYREEFGHRPLENDFATPTLFERPDLILRLITEQIHRPDDQQDTADLLQRRQREAAERLLAGRSETDRNRFQQVLERAALFNEIREEKVVYTVYYGLAVARYAFLKAGRRFAKGGTINRVEDVFFLTFDEVTSLLNASNKADMKTTVRQRRAERAWTASHPGPATFGEDFDFPDISWLPEPARRLTESFFWYVRRREDAGLNQERTTLAGSGVSPGRYRGRVCRVMGEPDFARLKPGDVLVCPVTTSAWGVLFGTAGALVTDHGGLLSHPSIAAREHGIPAVVGTREATHTLRDGQMVEVDGSTGIVKLIEPK